MRKKTKNLYWGENEEFAIVSYNNSNDPTERESLFNTFIYPALTKLAECVFNRFRFDYIDPIDAQIEAVSHMAEHLGYFDPERTNEGGIKAKSFSYFSTVCKYFYIQKNDSSYSKRKNNFSLDDFSQVDEEDELHSYMPSVDPDMGALPETLDFIAQLKQWWLRNGDKYGKSYSYITQYISQIAQIKLEADSTLSCGKRGRCEYIFQKVHAICPDLPRSSLMQCLVKLSDVNKILYQDFLEHGKLEDIPDNGYIEAHHMRETVIYKTNRKKNFKRLEDKADIYII